MATSKITLNGDEATGKTICHNPMVIDKGNGETHVFYCGLWYVDKFVRTPEGWRIKERVEEKSYMDAVNRGYQVVLPRDAVAGVPEEYANAVIDTTLVLLATVTTTDAVLACWS